jgi:carboxymethylenebutenolidase
MRALNEDWAVDAIRSAGQYLRSNSDVRAPAVGTIGFCMGGRLSLAAALKMVPIQAAVMYYGSVETDVQSLVPLKVPLLGIFGRDDHGISEQDVRRFEKALIQAGKQATILIYPGAGHAFFNEQRASYVREASNDAWERTRIFLDEHLRKQEPPRERIAPREPRIDR